MNKFLSLLALALLLSTASIAQSIVSFKAMGHDDEPIYGMIGASSFYLKISPLVEMKGSKLVLYIEPSQALIKDHSFVNIVINDRPAYSARLTKDSVEKISIDLTPEDLSADKFLKLQIKTLLTVSDDKCKDLDNPAMWVKVKDYSYLSLVKTTGNFFNNVNISNFVQLVCGIDYPAVANDGRTHVGVAHASRVLVSASRRNRLFPSIATSCDSEFHEKSAIARTRSPARATRALPGRAVGRIFM